jgi:pimeloyl-ACP methyl ester carboxylesterase
MDQEIRFCTTPDGVRIAYSTMGDGPPLVKVANWLSHLEHDQRSPVWRHWLRELSRDHLYVRYDERGCGLSDWDVENFSFDGWVTDLEAVVDALGIERFAMLGLSQGGPVAITYAARHPERVSHLILCGTYIHGWAKRNVPPEFLAEQEALITLTQLGWGRDTPAYRQLFTGLFVPDANEEQVRWFNELQRVSTSPENAVKFLREFGEIDVVDLLPKLAVPTLVLHARGDARCPFEEGRIMAASIPGSRFVPLDSRNHLLLEHEPAWAKFLAEVRSFLGVEPSAAKDSASSAAAATTAGGASRDQGDHAAKAEAASDEDANAADAASESVARRPFLQTLKERKLVQWALAYLAGAWVTLQVVDVVEGPWHLAEWMTRSVQVLLVIGFLVALVVAWYHGEKGRQKVSGAELIMIAALLAIAGLILGFLVP